VLVERMPAAMRWQWARGCAIAIVVWGGMMAAWTDAAYPWWDAATAAVSVAAQVLMARRKWENWVLWIAVDAALIPLYLAKGLTMLALLYLIYLVLAVSGLLAWRRAERSIDPASA
jgi:nicotinamide mononucleotide transporter